MHIIIVGCGRVGSELAVTLTDGGHEVVVVDRRAEALRRLPEGWKGTSVVGLGFDRQTLEAAEVGRADALAAVTSGDNSNILTARIAREHFEVANVVARIYDPRRAQLYQRLGIPTVATVTWTVGQVIRRLTPGELATEWADPGGNVVLVERALPPNWVGQDLGGLDIDDVCRVASVSRAGHAKVARPGLIGQEGDLLHVVIRQDAIRTLEERLEAQR